MTGPRGVHEFVSYLGYQIKVEENRLTVYTPDGLLLVSGRISLSTARRMIREQRQPAWMDDTDAAVDGAELERESWNHECEAADAARHTGRTE